MFRIATFAILLAACHHHSDPDEPQQPVAQPASQPTPGGQPAVETRNEGQIIVDIMIGQGYQCAVEETRWQCTVPSGGWPFYVSYVPTDNPVTIWFDSFENRAFARPCTHFTDAMKDLANGADFIVSCDDGSQQFRFNTYFSYAAGLDVNVLVTHHFEQRSNAVKLLDSIKAIRH